MKTFKALHAIATIIAIALAIFFFTNLVACRSVNKVQKSESAKDAVTKSDSSNSKVYTVIDTTKTDSSTEITTTTFEVDSIEYPGWNTAIELNTLSIGDSNNTPVGINAFGKWDGVTTGSNSTPIGPRIKAKGIRVTVVSSKQAAIVQKGQTTATEIKQTDKKESAVHEASKQESTVVKKGGWSWWIWLLIGAGLFAVLRIVWRRVLPLIVQTFII